MITRLLFPLLSFFLINPITLGATDADVRQTPASLEPVLSEAFTSPIWTSLAQAGSAQSIGKIMQDALSFPTINQPDLDAIAFAVHMAQNPSDITVIQRSLEKGGFSVQANVLHGIAEKVQHDEKSREAFTLAVAPLQSTLARTRIAASIDDVKASLDKLYINSSAASRPPSVIVSEKGMDTPKIELGLLPARPTLKLGMLPAEHNIMLGKQITFQESAEKIHDDLRIIDTVDLDQLKKEKVVIGFAGFSGGSGFDETASRMALTSLLRELDPGKVFLASGGTAAGFPNLVYEIGRRLGFKTIGITSLKAGDHKPADMDYLIVTGNDWGKESPQFIDAMDIMVVAGGGNQSFREMVAAQAAGRTVIAIANDRIIGASSRFRGKKYAKGDSAGRAITQAIDKMAFFRWVRTLPDHIGYALPEDIGNIFPGKRLIGFTGWSKNAPPGRDDRVREFVVALLGQMDPQKDIIVTGGSHLGAEKIVNEEATRLGFKIIAEVSHEVADPSTPFYLGVDLVVPVARTWNGRTFGFINNIDALVDFGGGEVVNTQAKLASARGIPHAHMLGNVTLSDKLTQKNRFRSGKVAGDFIEQMLGAAPAVKSP